MTDGHDDLENKLLSGDGKWWEFLDPETYQVKDNLPAATRSSSGMIDWSKAQKKRSPGPLGFGFFNRCDACGHPCPPDFTFCVHCGGNPRAPQSIYTYTIVIKEVDNPAARDAVAEIITEASHDLQLAEVSKILDELPAVFNVHERKDRIGAVLTRFAELGVYGKAFNVQDPSIPWISETFETILRDPKILVLALAAIAASVASLVFVGWGLFFVSLLALFGLFYYRLTWFRGRYEFDVNRVLDRCSGFDGIRSDAVDRLSRIQDDDVRGQLTICLMEYYALHTQFRAYESEYGDVLLRSDHALRELMEQILSVSGKFADLEFHLAGIEPAALNQRAAALQQKLESAGPTEADLIQKELATLNKERQQYGQMKDLMQQFRQRMRALASAMEALRVRVASVRRERDARFEEIPMEAILRELDDELEVFEQTVHALEA